MVRALKLCGKGRKHGGLSEGAKEILRCGLRVAGYDVKKAKGRDARASCVPKSWLAMMDGRGGV